MVRGDPYGRPPQLSLTWASKASASAATTFWRTGMYYRCTGRGYRGMKAKRLVVAVSALASLLLAGPAFVHPLAVSHVLKHHRT